MIWNLKTAVRMGLEVEALSGEGSIGNVTSATKYQTSEGLTRAGISGNILSNRYIDKLYQIVDKRELCDACRVKSPIRLGELDKDRIDDGLSMTGNYVKQCPICDAGGFMGADKVTTSKRNKPANFSAGLSVEPLVVQMKNRSRIDRSEQGGVKRTKKKKKSPEDNEKVDISTQMIMQQEVRSHVYGLVINLDLGRIGFDDERMCYVTNDVDFLVGRVKNTLLALRSLLIDIDGAKMATFAPQMSSLEGILTERRSGEELLGAVSPIHDNYREEYKALNDSAVEFDSTIELVKVFNHYLDEDYIRSMVERNLAYSRVMND